MQIVIDIKKREWEYLNKLVENGDQLGHYERLLVNGIPLPKEHGRLIDADGNETTTVNYDYLEEKTLVTIPDNPTNGDIIKAMFPVVGFTPLTLHTSSDRKEGFYVHIEDYSKYDFRLTVSKDWWNAPYEKEI